MRPEIALLNGLSRVMEGIAMGAFGEARTEAASLLSNLELASGLAPEVHLFVVEGLRDALSLFEEADPGARRAATRLAGMSRYLWDRAAGGEAPAPPAVAPQRGSLPDHDTTEPAIAGAPSQEARGMPAREAPLPPVGGEEPEAVFNVRTERRRGGSIKVLYHGPSEELARAAFDQAAEDTKRPVAVVWRSIRDGRIETVKRCDVVPLPRKRGGTAAVTVAPSAVAPLPVAPFPAPPIREEPLPEWPSIFVGRTSGRRDKRIRFGHAVAGVDYRLQKAGAEPPAAAPAPSGEEPEPEE